MTFPKPTGKKPTLAEAIAVMERLGGPPIHAARPEDPLLDHLLVGVLGLRTGAEKAREGIRALCAVFHDLNEARVSGLTELAEALEPFTGAEQARAAANDLRTALQDVYDGTHGLDLEPLRGRDPEDQRAFLKDLPNTPGGPASLVFQLALGEQRLALGPREQQALRRLHLLPGATGPARLRAAMEKVVPAGKRALFAWGVGACGRLFEKDFDPQHPYCRLLVSCRARELVERERERKKEELRRKAEEKRRRIEEEKRRRLELIAQKKREAEEARRAARAKVEEERRARAAAREAKAAAALAKRKAAREAREAAAKAAKAKREAAAKAKAKAKATGARARAKSGGKPARRKR